MAVLDTVGTLPCTKFYEQYNAVGDVCRTRFLSIGDYPVVLLDFTLHISRNYYLIPKGCILFSN